MSRQHCAVENALRSRRLQCGLRLPRNYSGGRRISFPEMSFSLCTSSHVIFFLQMFGVVESLQTCTWKFWGNCACNSYCLPVGLGKLRPCPLDQHKLTNIAKVKWLGMPQQNLVPHCTSSWLHPIPPPSVVCDGDVSLENHTPV